MAREQGFRLTPVAPAWQRGLDSLASAAGMQWEAAVYLWCSPYGQTARYRLEEHLAGGRDWDNPYRQSYQAMGPHPRGCGQAVGFDAPDNECIGGCGRLLDESADDVCDDCGRANAAAIAAALSMRVSKPAGNWVCVSCDALVGSEEGYEFEVLDDGRVQCVTCVVAGVSVSKPAVDVEGAWSGAFKDDVRDWEARGRAVQWTTGGHQQLADPRDGLHVAPSRVGSELRKKVKPVEVLDGQYGLDGKMRGVVQVQRRLGDE